MKNKLEIEEQIEKAFKTMTELHGDTVEIFGAKALGQISFIKALRWVLEKEEL